MSFFDETDEPTVTRSTPRRRAPSRGGRPPSRGGRRPPGDQQAIQIRRAVAAGIGLVLLVVIVLLVHSCQISQRNSALRSYTNDVSSLIAQSNQNGAQLFQDLSGAGSGANAAALQSQVNQARLRADSILSSAEHLSLPDEMRAAQQNLLLALQMRRDGLAGIGEHIQQALGTSTARDAVNAIAAEMALFYASDVVYTDYATHQIAGALHAAGLAVGGNGGETIQAGQFLSDLGWLAPDTVASRLGARVATPGGKPSPGLHGHSLDSVSVGGTTLQTGSTNTIAASPPPAFTFHFTNGGVHDEHNVVLRVKVEGTSVAGQTVVPTTTAGQSTTGQVTLSSAPPAGSYTVTATVGPVPGEKNTANNTLTFPVTFQ